MEVLNKSLLRKISTYNKQGYMWEDRIALGLEQSVLKFQFLHQRNEDKLINVPPKSVSKAVE